MDKLASNPSRFPQFPRHNLQVSGDYIIHSYCLTPLIRATSSSRIQCIPNQGQVDQASVIPNIDNMQQENLVPRNFGKSTRSQMENLQVQGLENRAARPNASNPGPDSSLQSQNRVLNTQQNLIAKRVDLDLSSEDDDRHRAAKLSEELWKKQKWILILDDLWTILSYTKWEFLSR
uniref:NB-ARC domain-containing protein n=1 Tax=Salix viminalis TaxID=40686 RepID=A0A6N2KM47_SALVM